jgi:NDP-4-keto-2,6-dideoxyhexose 3-C-methyltransferase
MYSEISKCRICSGEQFETVMDLGSQVLTGVFPKSEDEVVTSGPVELIRCSSEGGCGLVQLRQSYDLEEMYGMNYGYRSGLNSSMVEHLKRKVKKIIEMGVLNTDDLIIDIGSNDATTLKAYPESTYKLVGIDPTGVKFAEYYPENIKLVPEFFSAEAVAKATQGGKAKVITSFSMFYDLEDPVAFAMEVAGALHDEGVWVFEQSYLPAMLRANSFDTICHEHIDFYALRQIEWILEKAGMKVLDVEFNDVNGGSFSVTASKKASSLPQKTDLIDAILNDERDLALDTSAPYEKFCNGAEIAKRDFHKFLENARAEGKTVAGLGASTKGNVLLQHFNLSKSDIKSIGEVNPDKFGSFTPGTHIPLVDEKQLLETNPDYLVVLPWHFKSFFLSLPHLSGRSLVFPLPYLHIIEVD